jgi:DNA-binding NarL/FixJ family response regulator
MVQQPGSTILGVVHASRVIRDSTVAMLNEQPGMRVARAYGTVTDVLAEPIAGEHILLYDLATARQDGPARLMSLHAQLPQARILMFNVIDDDQAIIECVRVGASGCVLQDATMDDLIAAIRSVAGGIPHSSPRVITSLFSYVAGLQAGEDRTPLSTLTPREEQILQLLAGGMSNREIAQELHLQPQTVKNYVHLVLQKLDLRSRLDVIKLFRSTRR